jgi:hypothetical protein
MSSEELIFREMRNLLQSDSGRKRFCMAIVSKGQSFLANENALRIAAMATMPYRMYLTTDHWRSVSADAKERAGNRCQLCNSRENIEAHHRTYERRGCEEPSDITVLCTYCHGRFHTKPTPDERLEPAASDPVEMRLAGMTEQEQSEWLSQTIASKRREQGIDPATGELKRETVKTVSSILRQRMK